MEAVEVFTAVAGALTAAVIGSFAGARLSEFSSR